MDAKQIVHSDPQVVSGTPVFVGTRVPAQALLDYLEGGETIEEFLDDFPSVTREQAVAFLEEAGGALFASIALDAYCLTKTYRDGETGRGDSRAGDVT